MNYETALEIEYAVATYFNYRVNVIVPNVYPMSFGIHPGGFEMDIAILSARGYLQEVEIKVSKTDLIKDADKDKWRYYPFINVKKLWFAIPEKMISCMDLVPDIAGILCVYKTGKVRAIRQPKANNIAMPLTPIQQFKFARLGAIRVWPMKHNILIEIHRGEK